MNSAAAHRPLEIETYLSIPQASERLGVPQYALRAAAKNGLFPLYRPFSNRWAVKISEVEAAIARTRAGAAGQ
jgi:hypothetical protein